MLTQLATTDPTEVGPYRLQGRLGAGGMGTVYLGFGPDGRSAAVKVIRPELVGDGEFRERFRREVVAARRVRSQFVAEVRDADVEADQPWMATDYIDGVSLAAAVNTRSRLDGPVLTGLAVGLADALVAIHRAGLVHRDLKPSNVLLAWDGPKIIDFGIARQVDRTDQTHSGHLVGTFSWMAPEQLRGKPAGAPSDIFNWALCVAYAATGRHAFEAESPAASAFRVMHDKPDLTGTAPRLEPLVHAALDKEPSHRPTAAELMAALTGETATTTAAAEEATRALVDQVWSYPPPNPPRAQAQSQSPSPSAPPSPITATETTPSQPKGPRSRVAVLAALLVVGIVVASTVFVLAKNSRRVEAEGSPGVTAESSGSPSATPPASQQSPTTTTVPPSSPVGSAPVGSSPVGSSPTGDTPSPVVTDVRPRQGVLVTVVAPEGSVTVPAWNGPSTDASVFGRRGSVTAGTRLTLYCNVYGQFVSAPRGATRLWGYTNAGWLNDRFMITGSTDPTTPACTGNVREPDTGDQAPRSDAGPYPVVAGQASVSVRQSAGSNATAIATLNHGDLVAVTCHANSTDVAPPPGVAAASNQWDRLATGGWLPDVHVYSGLSESPVPPCAST